MQKNQDTFTFEDFIKIVRRLRKECPWDREQTHQSIRHSLIEEAYEVVESITKNDYDELKKELGDLLLHIVLHSIIAEETHEFTLDGVITSASQKMIRRHPHVFGDREVENADDVKKNWEHSKLEEGRISVVDGIPSELPALLHAQRIQEKASKVGFDWKEKSDVWKKLLEEISELETAEHSKEKAKIDEELGDVLFSIVNYARFLDVNPEFSLHNAIKKFKTRFQKIEAELKQQGKSIHNVTLEEMDAIWNKHKNNPDHTLTFL